MTAVTPRVRRRVYANGVSQPSRAQSFATGDQPRAGRGPLIRSVALPTEHGGWSFLFEPIVLGLLVAWSLPGLVLSLAVIFAFLAHQPVKTALKDRRAGRRAYRTVWAERFAFAYGAGAVIAFGVSLRLGAGRAMPVLVAVAGFALIQLVWDARNKSRALWPELAGAVALAGIAPAIAAIAGWRVGALIGLWAALCARSLPAIVYVRDRLKLERAKPCSVVPTAASHAAAFVAVVGFASAELVPWLAAVIAALLLARAVHGLSGSRIGRRASMIGVQEIVFGLIVVAAIAAGYAAGL